VLLISPASILAAYLIAEGLVTDPSDGNSWPLYVSYMSDEIGGKTNAGAIFNTPGLKDGRYMVGTVVQHFGIRIEIRSRAHNDGWAKLEAIATNLDSVQNESVVVSGETYLIQNVSRVEPMIPEGTEKGTKKRQLFSHNFRMTVKITS